MIYLATRFGPGGPYAEAIDAETKDKAIEVCNENGWVFEGELMLVIPADRAVVHDGNETKH